MDERDGGSRPIGLVVDDAKMREIHSFPIRLPAVSVSGFEWVVFTFGRSRFGHTPPRYVETSPTMD